MNFELAPVAPVGQHDIVPTTLRQANAFVAAYHRHSKPTRGQKFSIGCEVGGLLVGVAISGRPNSRVAQAWPDRTAEVLRVCAAEGCPNVCSKLYGASRRALVAMGYQKVITYILVGEPSASLRAAGFRVDCDRKKSDDIDCRHYNDACPAFVRGRGWSCESRPRDDDHHTIAARVRYCWP